MSASPVLVLRPQPGADETAQALANRGISAVVRPVLVTRPLRTSRIFRALVQHLDSFDAVVFVSPAAVRFGMPWIAEGWPQYPMRPTWLAVGERTRHELAAWNVEALSPEDARTEGLLDLVALAAPDSERMLLVRGEGGREMLADALEARGVRVDHLVVYTRQALRTELPAPDQTGALIATSSDVVDAFLATGGEHFTERPLLVPSTRVADHAQQLGFRCVQIMHGMSVAVMLDSLARLGITGRQQQGD